MHGTGRVRAVAVAAAVALLAAGCGGSSRDDAAGPPSATPSTTPSAARTTAPPPAPTTSPPAPTSSRPTPRPSTAPPPPSPDPTTAPAACPGRDVEVLPTSARQVALTVDLGSGSEGLAPILSALAAHGARATFFVTGSWARRDPAGLRAIAAAGHEIGNHTDTHPHLPALGDDAVRAELAAADAAVRAVTGATTRPLFRFPFGDRDDRTLRLVSDDGWCAYRWTVDTLGWQGTSGGRSAASVHERVLAALRPGAIVLMHGGAHPDDRSTLDADALPGLLDALAERGYAFTTLPGR